MSTYYAHPLVYLFFGGFVIARALEQTNLHYRIALWILRKTGTEGRGLLAGFMLSTGFMSMWISNTATSIMMLPIVTSVLAVLPKNVSVKVERPLLLSVAWAANIGGMATLIGTPPNMIFAGFLGSILEDFWAGVGDFLGACFEGFGVVWGKVSGRFLEVKKNMINLYRINNSL